MSGHSVCYFYLVAHGSQSELILRSVRDGVAFPLSAAAPVNLTIPNVPSVTSVSDNVTLALTFTAKAAQR